MIILNDIFETLQLILNCFSIPFFKREVGTSEIFYKYINHREDSIKLNKAVNRLKSGESEIEEITFSDGVTKKLIIAR